MESILEIQGLTKTYPGGLTALDAVDLRFEVLLPIVATAIGASAIVSSLTRQRQE